MNNKNKALVDIISKFNEAEEPIIVVTKNGTGVNGVLIDILMMLSDLVRNLQKNGMGKEEIMTAIEVGLLTDNEREKMLNDFLKNNFH